MGKTLAKISFAEYNRKGLGALYYINVGKAPDFVRQSSPKGENYVPYCFG